jgi:hypothetical protein
VKQTGKRRGATFLASNITRLWLSSGEHKYGERKALVESEEWSGPEFQTCKNIASVCRAFPTTSRRQYLSFEHHATLAALRLKPAFVDELLDWCEAPLKNGANVNSYAQEKNDARTVLIRAPLLSLAPFVRGDSSVNVARDRNELRLTSKQFVQKLESSLDQIGCGKIDNGLELSVLHANFIASQ